MIIVFIGLFHAVKDFISTSLEVGEMMLGFVQVYYLYYPLIS